MVVFDNFNSLRTPPRVNSTHAKPLSPNLFDSGRFGEIYFSCWLHYTGYVNQPLRHIYSEDFSLFSLYSELIFYYTNNS